MKCQLICMSKETRELFVTGENLIDGTPCSYENSSDICIQVIYTAIERSANRLINRISLF